MVLSGSLLPAVGITLIGILATVCVYFWTRIVVVPHKHVAVVERLGKFSRVLKPGFHVLSMFEETKTPQWLYQKNHKASSSDAIVGSGYVIPIDTNICYDCPSWECWSADRVNVDVDTVVYYKIMDAEAAVYAYGDPIAAMSMMVQTTLVECIRDLSVHDISTTMLQASVERLATKKFETFSKESGIHIGALRIQQVVIPDSIAEATAKQVASRLEAQTKRQRLEAEHETRLEEIKQRSEIEAREYALASEQAKRDKELAYLKGETEAAGVRAVMPVFESASKDETVAELLSQYLGIDILTRMMTANSDAGIPMVLPQEAINIAVGMRVGRGDDPTARSEQGTRRRRLSIVQ